MGKKEKLIRRLKTKPRDFTFREAESLLASLGFTFSNKGKTSGSRVEFELEGFTILIHKPHPHKEFLMYQVVDLLSDLEYGGFI